MRHTIGGNVTVKNSIAWDYCLRQCVESLLPVCDVVNLVDSDSDDGTKELLSELSYEHPQVRVLNYKWPEQHGNIDCILDKMNWSRERLGTHYHLHLEADEVLGKESYDYILKSAEEPSVVLGVKRLNFWLDNKHLLGEGCILSPYVIRFAPTAYWLGGDAPHPKATQTEPAANWSAREHCFIYHYGFLRKPGPYFEKFKNLMKNINGSELADPTIYHKMKDCIDTGKNWMEEIPMPMTAFTGSHPESMKPWLSERGYHD